MLAFLKKLSSPILTIALCISFFFLGWNVRGNYIKNIPIVDTEHPQTQGVSEVTDGDTFILNNDIIVRMNGINAPDEGEANYNKSKEFLEKLLPSGKQVFLEYDRYQDDKYKRLLAWAWIDCEETPKFLPANYMHKSNNESMPGLIDNPEGCKNGKLVNEELVKSGFAKPVVYKDRGPTKYQGRISNPTSF